MEAKLCIILDADYISENNTYALERNYNSYFKNIIAFLNEHKEFLLTIGFTSFQVKYYLQKHPEIAGVLHDLLARKQIEILGDGYYSPIFPLLSPLDRVGQIESMTMLLKSAFGKRVNGIRPFLSIWDQSLITSFSACGMDYAVLSNDVIAKDALNGFPLILSELGKAIKIIPLTNDLAPKEDEKAAEWILRLEEFSKPKGNSSGFCEEENDECFSQLISFSIPMETFTALINTSFFSDFMGLDPARVLSLPSLYLRTGMRSVRSHAMASMEKRAAKWCGKAFEETPVTQGNTYSLQDYLNTYPPVRRLYERVTFISSLISQQKGGDASRKKAASNLLRAAQAGYNFISYSTGLPAPESKRQGAFRILSMAEGLARDAAKSFKESASSYDYNCDGFNEYVCQMNQYSAVLSQKAAIITDFNFLKSGANYAENLSRIEKFDGFYEFYRRGFFRDYLFTAESDFAEYAKTKGVSHSPFLRTLAKETHFDYRRREIKLEMRALFTEDKIPVSLQKNFTFFSSSITVQYILKNEGEREINGIFAVELDLPQTRFEKRYSSPTQYYSEYVVDDKRIESRDSFDAQSGVSFIQIKDIADKKVFILEPNEESGVSSSVIFFRRPSADAARMEKSSSYITTLFWDMHIAGRGESEKTLTLTVVSLKKLAGGLSAG